MENTHQSNLSMNQIIQRHPGFRRGLGPAISKRLTQNGKKTFSRSQVSRVVSGKVELNPNNIVIKEAFDELFSEYIKIKG